MRNRRETLSGVQREVRVGATAPGIQPGASNEGVF